MGRVEMTSGGGSIVDLDVITTGAGDIVKGKVGVDNDGEPLVGTLALSGNATEAYVYNGKTFYSTDPKVRKTGKMTVNSLLSFKAAVTSGRKVAASWGNPKQASGKPYSGVYIRYSTSGYPGKTGGTQIYKGAGSNTASGGTSTAALSLPNLNTKYYLSIYPYVTCSAGEITGNVLNAAVTTGKEQVVTCTSSKTVKVPEGYTKADMFCVGGGGAGNHGALDHYSGYGGGGGGGGYTKTVKGITVSPGEALAVVVGAGGRRDDRSDDSGNDGSASSVSRNQKVLCQAEGGKNGIGTIYHPGDGGSGGGGGGDNEQDGNINGGDGGTNGSDGENTLGGNGTGQGTTTRAWGSPSGTVYSGGGGGGGGMDYSARYFLGSNGAAGSGGGGRGGNAGATGNGEPGTDGAANTGGGGGGGSAHHNGGDYGTYGGAGGSGIVLMKFY